MSKGKWREILSQNELTVARIKGVNYIQIPKIGTRKLDFVLAQVEKEAEERTIKWLNNYWKTLKEHGMTEHQLIIEFNKYLKKLLSSSKKE